MVPDENKATRLSLVNHTTKTVHHHFGLVVRIRGLPKMFQQVQKLYYSYNTVSIENNSAFYKLLVYAFENN